MINPYRFCDDCGWWYREEPHRCKTPKNKQATDLQKAVNRLKHLVDLTSQSIAKLKKHNALGRRHLRVIH